MDQKTLKQLEKVIARALVNVATKDVLASLEKRITRMVATMATKNDLLSLEKRVGERFASKEDLKNELNKLEMNIVKLVDKHKADIEQVSDLKRRVKRIEGELQIV